MRNTFISTAIILAAHYLWFPLIFIAFVPFLFTMLYASEKRRVLQWFLHASVLITLWHLISLFWIFKVGKFTLMGNVLLGITSLIIVLVLPWLIRPRLGLQRALFGLPFFWILVEWMQIQIGFPFLTLGNLLPNVQWYSILGVLGGSCWIWFFNLLAFYIVRKYLEHRQIKPLIGQSILLLIFFGWGINALGNKLTKPSEGEMKEIILNAGDEEAEKTYAPAFPWHTWMPDKMVFRLAAVQARERREPVIWSDNLHNKGVDWRGKEIESSMSAQTQVSKVETYHSRVGNFPVRMAIFIAIFMFLYLVSMGLRGARYGEPK
ncbi:MAG: hypothetical protein JJU02_16030 [Cryomorphaceae bacterium]|nr:hypothetical protein [Cryomorphaceae bacterium]